MIFTEIIKKKRDNIALNKEEIDFFINELVAGKIHDYQVSALLMAMVINDLNAEETALLTDAMMKSGELIDLSKVEGIKVDKHSTGGVGDTTSLILAPMVASCGVKVAKMSGRGLGHTGGTIDKLESISGFKVSLSMSEFIEALNKYNLAIISQSDDISPADKKIYAIRDVTATVEHAGLIAASIMSKKLALGSDAIVLDIKTGSGAFMKTEKEAEKLAKEMIDIASKLGKKVSAFITNMSEPLGFAVGNKLEVIEALMVLKNEGPVDLKELCIELGTEMVFLGKKDITISEARDEIIRNLENGKAFDKFKDLVLSQGGNLKSVDELLNYEPKCNSHEISASSSGYLNEIKTEQVGKLALLLGAGRQSLEDEIDKEAGVLLRKKVGEKIEKGETLAILYSSDKSKIDNAIALAEDCFKIDNVKPLKTKLILRKMRA